MLAAVKADGNALKFASEALRADRAVVLAAAKQNGSSLQYAYFELYSDPQLIATAALTHPAALRFAIDEVASALFDGDDPWVVYPYQANPDNPTPSDAELSDWSRRPWQLEELLHRLARGVDLATALRTPFRLDRIAADAVADLSR